MNRAIWMLLLAAGLSGCGGGKGTGGGIDGGGARGNPAAPGCLAQAPELQAGKYDTVALMTAFASASARCGAEAADVRARALEMERNGINLEAVQSAAGGNL